MERKGLGHKDLVFSFFISIILAISTIILILTSGLIIGAGQAVFLTELVLGVISYLIVKGIYKKEWIKIIKKVAKISIVITLLLMVIYLFTPAILKALVPEGIEPCEEVKLPPCEPNGECIMYAMRSLCPNLNSYIGLLIVLFLNNLVILLVGWLIGPRLFKEKGNG
ncbi:MAG TPA: hypothetical protein VI912_00845 [Candidatus Bilamarchaeaceae archaeon]|nr:hypothetical protein [Candidatus Bilamarchaeaceae archaeon]